MKWHCFPLLSLSAMVAGCTNTPNACEQILEIKEQQAQCELLKKQISAATKSTILRTELERRYQTDCVETRYYRDEHQQAICDNKQQMKAIEKSKK